MRHESDMDWALPVQKQSIFIERDLAVNKAGNVRRFLLLVGLFCLLLSGCGRELNPVVTRTAKAKIDRDLWAKRMVTLSAPLTLKDAVRYALAHNLDYSLLQSQRAIQREALTGARLAMLPALEARGESSWRSKLRVSSSKSASSGRESLEPSFASEKNHATASFELVWSVLDFGIAYFHSRQASHQGKILDQRMRRTRQNLILDVVKSYHATLVADFAVKEAKQILADLEQHQATIAKQLKDNRVSELQGLESEEILVLMQIRLQEFERELMDAKLKLGTLIGLSPGSEIDFAAVDFTIQPGEFKIDLPALETEAIHNRPELFEQDLEEKIAIEEVRANIAKLFPSPVGFFGAEVDRNKFLKHKDWWTAGIRASWNLLALPRKWSGVRQARRNRSLMRERRLALAVGVITQTHLSAIEYQNATSQYRLARSLDSVRERKLLASTKRVGQGQMDESALLEIKVAALFAKIRYQTAYGNLVVSKQRIANTVGRSQLISP